MSDHIHPTLFPSFVEKRITTSQAEINLVVGGEGPPLLLLHGNPQTHVMWHKVAPRLAQHFTVVATDSRGYGDSSKPKGKPDHSNYSKRALALDQVEVMETLGFASFQVAGHDRGGRVAHRMALDHPDRVTKVAFLDILPTYDLYRQTNKEFAISHWTSFFYMQPYDLPERLIAGDPEYFIRINLTDFADAEGVFPEEAVAEYIRCFTPAEIHAACEDYRASFSIDDEHDTADRHLKLHCPVLVLWGLKGACETCFDMKCIWRDRVEDVIFQTLDTNHYLAEEDPDRTFEALYTFFCA
jgi:haloacetate dehalogenase